MSYITIVGVAMLAVIIGLISTKKVAFPIATSAIPILVAVLALGMTIPDINKILLPALSDMFVKTALMLLFAMLYFNMISEAGVFDTIVQGMIKATKGRLNVYIAMILTAVLSSIAMLSSHVATAYMITFPALVPLYKKLKLDRRYMLIITTVSVAMMSFLPWGVGVTTMAAFSGISPSELAPKVLPSAFLFIPVFPILIIYFGRLHKKKMGTILVLEEETAVTEVAANNPNNRPKLFWLNMLILILTILTLVLFDSAAYLIFMISYSVTAIINYPKPSVQSKINSMVAGSYFNILTMLMSIAVFIGIFNKTGMSKAFVALLMSLLPHAVLRYAHIILLLFVVIVTRYLPFQIYLSVIPVLIGIGKGFGLSAAQVVTAYVPQTGLGTGSSPMTGSTYVGVGLAEVEMEEYCKLAVPIQSAVNAFTIILGLITGIYM